MTRQTTFKHFPTICLFAGLLSATVKADDRFTATVWDVGDYTCVTVEATDATYLFTNDPSADGPCSKAIVGLTGKLDQVIYAGPSEDKPNWPTANLFDAGSISALSEEARYLKQGALEVDYMTLSEFDARANGFAVKFTYAHGRLLLLSDDAGLKAMDNCFEANDDQRFLLGADVMVVPPIGKGQPLSPCFRDVIKPHFALAGENEASRKTLLALEASGMHPRNILQTNRQSLDSGTKDCPDPAGDDTVQVTITNDSVIEAQYLSADAGCS